MGHIVTFYSFKGGVGRSMSLANVAVLLANWGYKVLAIDFDLEAPGLENFFARSIDIDEARNALGVIDVFSDAAASGRIMKGSEWQQYILKIRLSRVRGDLSLLTAGRRSPEYFKQVRNLDFAEFYSTKNGGTLVEELRKELKSKFDFILVDSRTGFTEIGGICTVQLPDSIALFFTATKQGLEGGIDIVNRAASARHKLPFERPTVPVIPVPSRLDMSAEFRLTQGWLDIFSQELANIFSDWLPRTVNPRTFLELLKLPHVSFLSYGETLPVLEQGTTDPAGLGYAYETLAALIAHDLQKTEMLISDRATFIKEASHDAPQIAKEQEQTTIFVSYSHSDAKWVDQLKIHLAPLTRSRSLVVWDDTRIRAGSRWTDEIKGVLSKASVAVLIVSPDYLASDFILDDELPALLKASEEQGLRVLWIAARASSYMETPLARYQALNDPSKPLESLSLAQRDKVMVSAAEKIALTAGQPY